MKYFIVDIWFIVLDYLLECPKKFKDFIDPDKIDWYELSFNLAAIRLLEANPDKINWYYVIPHFLKIIILNLKK